MIITFAPCGRAKTMVFIKWLGMMVPAEVEERILGAESPVAESVKLLGEVLSEILEVIVWRLSQLYRLKNMI